MNKLVSFLYYWTYFNLLIFVICILIGVIDVEIHYPKQWATISLFSIFYCFIFFSSPLLCLYMKDKFDLVKMKDGVSYISQLIWIIISLLVNLTATLTQVVGVRELMEVN